MDSLGLCSIFKSVRHEGREWVIGECSNGHIWVATRCDCGQVMHELVIDLGGPPAEVSCLRIGCRASGHGHFSARRSIPPSLAVEARQLVAKQNSEAQAIRAASGGSGAWIPI